jgi:predicted nucleic acid-binding protein
MRSISPHFLDTNILIYAVSDDPKSMVAGELLERPFIISAQALNEFANAAHKKLGMSWQDIGELLQNVVTVAAAVVAVDETLSQEAVVLAARYNLSFYDAAMIAAALRTQCECFYSEDMHDGLVIESRLTITNPFKAAAQNEAQGQIQKP